MNKLGRTNRFSHISIAQHIKVKQGTSNASPQATNAPSNGAPTQPMEVATTG